VRRKQKKEEHKNMEKEKFESKKAIPVVLDSIIEFIAPAFDAKYIPFWLSMSGICLVSLAYKAVYDLFKNHIGVDKITAAMDAFASVGILSVLLVVVVAAKNNAVKAWATC
jgi:hypothetical protein